MLLKEKCAECGGTGISFIETSSFLGLIKKQVPISCPTCGGKGYTLRPTPCKYCDGRGLIGNEKAVCRVCNGTGKADEFAWVPRSKLVPGTMFPRVCTFCRTRTSHEILTEVVVKERTVSWEEEDSLRQVHREEQVRVRCTECDDTYWLIVDPEAHPEELTPEMEEFLAARPRMPESGLQAHL